MTHRTRQRIGTVVFAPAAALAAWAFIQLVGIDLVVSNGIWTVGPTDVIGAAHLGALAAWVVVRALERRSVGNCSVSGQSRGRLCLHSRSSGRLVRGRRQRRRAHLAARRDCSRGDCRASPARFQVTITPPRSRPAGHGHGDPAR